MTQTGGELLIWGQDCGNGHELPRVAVKIREFLAKAAPVEPQHWGWQLIQKFSVALRRSRPGGAVLLWSPPASRRSAAAVPKTRRCVPPPKKAETFRQGCASLTRPVLSLAGLLNKDQTHWVCTSQGLLYNRPLCRCSTEDAAQNTGLHLTYCTQPCLQRAFTAMHISSLMDDDDWGRALTPVCIYCHGFTHTHKCYIPEWSNCSQEI